MKSLMPKKTSHTSRNCFEIQSAKTEIHKNSNLELFLEPDKTRQYQQQQSTHFGVDSNKILTKINLKAQPTPPIKCQEC